MRRSLSTEYLSTIPNPCGKLLEYKIPLRKKEFFLGRGTELLLSCSETRKVHKSPPLRFYYRQELIFAVISRILFCILVSPFFSATSTLRMP